MNKNIKKKGFTIVELVIVIAVIAILAAVMIPTFSGIVDKAENSAALQEARALYTEYIGNVDYAGGKSAEQALVIKVGEAGKEKYLAVKNAQMQDEVYATADDAAEAAGIADVANDGTTTYDYIVVSKATTGSATPVTITETCYAPAQNNG